MSSCRFDIDAGKSLVREEELLWREWEVVGCLQPCAVWWAEDKELNPVVHRSFPIISSKLWLQRDRESWVWVLYHINASSLILASGKPTSVGMACGAIKELKHEQPGNKELFVLFLNLKVVLGFWKMSKGRTSLCKRLTCVLHHLHSFWSCCSTSFGVAPQRIAECLESRAELRMKQLIEKELLYFYISFRLLSGDGWS